MASNGRLGLVQNTGQPVVLVHLHMSQSQARRLSKEWARILPLVGVQKDIVVEEDVRFVQALPVLSHPNKYSAEPTTKAIKPAGFPSP
jgi:hypothetical protein